MITYIKRLVDWLYALRRGEKLTGKPGDRGRVYVSRKTGEADSGPLAAKAQPTMTITPRRVWVEKEQRWYDYEDYLVKQAKG
jgi:hypothetical protein